MNFSFYPKAFKIAKEQESGTAGTSVVRMSFATDLQFFPYGEPASQRQQSPDLPPEIASQRDA